MIVDSCEHVSKEMKIKCMNGSRAIWDKYAQLVFKWCEWFCLHRGEEGGGGDSQFVPCPEEL